MINNNVTDFEVWKNVLLFRNVLAAPLHCNIMVCEIFCMGLWTDIGA